MQNSQYPIPEGKSETCKRTTSAPSTLLFFSLLKYLLFISSDMPSIPLFAVILYTICKLLRYIQIHRYREVDFRMKRSNFIFSVLPTSAAGLCDGLGVTSSRGQESRSTIFIKRPMSNINQLKKLCAEKAVESIKSGMVVGLGTGSTAYYAGRRHNLCMFI